ncbi:MAG TPA: hypothetical protein VMJ10_00325 [Kofleriaceae bacterium]|nr:hypothetical protein [Kofleriaceae bacterium]
MTLRDALQDAYTWGADHGTLVLVAAIAIPLVGALAAQLGKGGRTDADGRAIASVVIGLGVIAMLGEIVALHLAHAYFDTGVLDADIRLVVAPIACLASSLVAIRWVFPLGELRGARMARDLALLFAGCWALVWFFSMFQGWSIMFYGRFVELLVMLAIAGWYLRKLFKRTFA